MSKPNLERKCDFCEDKFFITEVDTHNIIFYDKKFYHSKCFVDLCNTKIENSKKFSKKWNNAIKNIDEIKDQSQLHIQELLIKNDIYNFIREQYEISIIPTLIWKKLNDIYEGNIVTMEKGIPPIHLFDMWKQKISKLNKIYQQNVIKGRKMATAQRISYDLSILINKYDSYLKWLEKNKILEIEKKEKNDTLVQDNIINHPINISQSQNQNDEDIMDLVDDIFG